MITEKEYLMHSINNASNKLISVLVNYVKECAPLTWSIGVRDAINHSSEEEQVKK